MSVRRNPFNAQNTQDMIDESDFKTYSPCTPPRLVMDLDPDDRWNDVDTCNKGVMTSPDLDETNRLFVNHHSAEKNESRRSSCTAIVTAYEDEDHEKEVYHNLKPRPSLGASALEPRGSIVLELPQLHHRSPRGSITGDFNGDRSRCGSACSASSNASAISWTTLQALRRSAAAAAAALGSSSRASSFAAATEYSMCFGADPDFFPQFDSGSGNNSNPGSVAPREQPTMDMPNIEFPTASILDPSAGRVFNENLMSYSNLFNSLILF